MRIFLITVLLNFLFCASRLGQDFGTAIKDDADSLWSLSPDKFKSKFGSPEIYKWKNSFKSVLTYDSRGAKTKLLFFKQPIRKAYFTFKSKQLQGISLLLAKPDVLPDKKAYFEHVANLKEQIVGWGKIGAPKVRKRKTKNAYRYTYSWRSPEYYISLRCSYRSNSKKTFKPGNIKISIFHRVSLAVPGKKNKTALQAAAAPDIKTDYNGDHYLEVEMIEEYSQKECVVVCVKRIFAYYQTAPKKRSWEKISKNLSLNVKSARGLKQVFASIASECRCHFKKLVATSVFDDFDSVMKFLRDYNKQAAKAKKKSINSYKVNSFEKLLKVMDGDVLVNTRNNPKKIKEFKSKVCKEIDAAKPILWIVFLGVVKENPETVNSGGGQARLIIGYNHKTNEVIYSDNWGEGHELKKMSWKKAWAITLTALAVTIKK